jgi:hypothetical protein
MVGMIRCSNERKVETTLRALVDGYEDTERTCQ